MADELMASVSTTAEDTTPAGDGMRPDQVDVDLACQHDDEEISEGLHKHRIQDRPGIDDDARESR